MPPAALEAVALEIVALEIVALGLAALLALDWSCPRLGELMITVMMERMMTKLPRLSLIPFEGEGSVG